MFARALLLLRKGANARSRPIGLVPCAIGGASLDEWQMNYTGDPTTSIFCFVLFFVLFFCVFGGGGFVLFRFLLPRKKTQYDITIIKFLVGVRVPFFFCFFRGGFCQRPACAPWTKSVCLYFCCSHLVPKHVELLIKTKYCTVWSFPYLLACGSWFFSQTS